MVKMSKFLCFFFLIFLALIIVPSAQGNWLDDLNKNGLDEQPSTGEHDEITYILYPLANETEDFQPRHVHLSRKFAHSMTVTWSTKGLPDLSFVEYGSSESTLTNLEKATSDVLNSRSIDGTSQQYIHEATLIELIPGQIIYYRCVSHHGEDEVALYTKINKFRLSPDTLDGDGGDDDGWFPKLLIFGDLGVENPATLPYLQAEIETDTYDAIFHIGDIAYQMNTGGGVLGDLFMEEIESMASRVPYQVSPGNHDVDLFSDYNEFSKRFRMPGDFDSLVYSWNLGRIHFVSISSEFYFYNVHRIEQQYNWLKNDLEEANRVRDVRPWIIVYGHTPFYCSNANEDSCTKVNSPLRVGCANNLCHGLENLFFENGVDLVLWGHEHSYEASFPVYNYTVLNGSFEEPYTNPRAPIHLITGAAGNKWEHDGYDESVPQPEWSRFRNTDYSYSRMSVFNSSHLLWEQIVVPEGTRSYMAGPEILDSFYLIQENHGPFPPPPEKKISPRMI